MTLPCDIDDILTLAHELGVSVLFVPGEGLVLVGADGERWWA